MKTQAVGKVLVAAKIEDLSDLWAVERGWLSSDRVCSVEVADAVVDRRATMLSLPKRLIEQLGLEYICTRRARTTNGVANCDVYSTAQLTIQGRDCRVDVAQVGDDCPVLIGQIPLESLDFVVDPVGQRLIGNPDHHGEQMIDLF